MKLYEIIGNNTKKFEIIRKGIKYYELIQNNTK